MKILNKRQALLLHQHLVAETGGSSGLRDEGLLESALNTPIQSFGDASAYPSLQQKAARLCYGLVQNHPFVDGKQANRRSYHVCLSGIEWRGAVLHSERTGGYHFTGGLQ